MRKGSNEYHSYECLDVKFYDRNIRLVEPQIVESVEPTKLRNIQMSDGDMVAEVMVIPIHDIEDLKMREIYS